MYDLKYEESPKFEKHGEYIREKGKPVNYLHPHNKPIFAKKLIKISIIISVPFIYILWSIEPWLAYAAISYVFYKLA